MEKYDVVIIGAGAAGLSAGIYAGRYNMKTLVIGKEFGGETARAGKIENYPGINGIDGYKLMEDMKEHAEHVGAKVVSGEVTKIEKREECFDVFAEDEKYHTTNIIIAFGAERRRLGLPNEDELTGKGVHYCVTCDGPIYAGKTVALVGGGDAAVKGVNMMAGYTEKVYLLVRGDKLRAEPVNQEEMRSLGDKVEVLFNTEVKEILKNDKGFFDKIILSREHNGSSELDTDALFIEIGAAPNTKLTDPLGVSVDDIKYIEVDNMMKTNVHGIFAAGDIVNHFGHFKQDITAAAMGAVAATSAHEHYKKHGLAGGCSHTA